MLHANQSTELRKLVRSVSEHKETTGHSLGKYERALGKPFSEPKSKHFLILKGLIVPLARNKEILIGRDASRCDVVITDDRVSRTHARITCRNGQYYIEDLNSANGTYINGKQVKGHRRLMPSDHIVIKPYNMCFVDERNPSLAKAPKRELDEGVLLGMGHSSGLLNRLYVMALFKLLNATNQHGRLTLLDAQGEHAEFTFCNGSVIHASYRTFRNQEAVQAFLQHRPATRACDAQLESPPASAPSSINQYIFSWCAAA